MTSPPNTTFSRYNGVVALTCCANRRAGYCWVHHHSYCLTPYMHVLAVAPLVYPTEYAQTCMHTHTQLL